MEHATISNQDDRQAAPVPLVDLEPVTRAVSADVLSDLAELMEEGTFVNGRPVEAFEEAFAAACNRVHCVGVASGLDALRLALAALEVGPGDEVIVPAMTFVATFEAVAQVGAIPVPVDVRADDCGLDVKSIEAARTSRTRVLLPVHLYGQMSDMVRLGEVAQRQGLLVLEDACQAHGAERDGRHAGSCSDAAAFSFYPSKNLGAMGDAGALVTDDAPLAQRVRALREHGQTGRYRSDYIGYTARLDAIQAVVLSRKLPLLDGWNEQRRAAAALYADALVGVGDLRLPKVVSGSLHVWHLYTVRTSDPEGLAAHLSTHGIATGRHYPEPPHLSRAFSQLGYGRGAFPVAEAIGAETLSLPLYPGITETQIARVAAAVRNYFAHA